MIIFKHTTRCCPDIHKISEENLRAAKKYFSKKYSEKNPTSLLIFQDVTANTEEVCEKTRDYAEDVVLCISNLTNSSIEIRGWLTEGKLEGFKVIRPTINFPHYQPTYSKPETLEKVAQKILQNISKSHLLELALKYEKDALSYEEEKFRILKRWSALEFIARNTPRIPMKDYFLKKT